MLSIFGVAPISPVTGPPFAMAIFGLFALIGCSNAAAKSEKIFTGILAAVLLGGAALMLAHNLGVKFVNVLPAGY